MIEVMSFKTSIQQHESVKKTSRIEEKETVCQVT